MDIPKVSKSVRRITVLQEGPSGTTVPVVVYERASSRKRKPALRIVERVARRLAEAQRSAAESYLSRHEASNEEREDGWIRDFPVNMLRAGESGRRALKVENSVDELLDDVEESLD